MGTVYVHKTFDTREEAEAFLESYYRQYHPAGYGTTLVITHGLDSGFIVSGSRLSSCD